MLIAGPYHVKSNQSCLRCHPISNIHARSLQVSRTNLQPHPHPLKIAETRLTRCKIIGSPTPNCWMLNFFILGPPWGHCKISTSADWMRHGMLPQTLGVGTEDWLSRMAPGDHVTRWRLGDDPDGSKVPAFSSKLTLESMDFCRHFMFFMHLQHLIVHFQRPRRGHWLVLFIAGCCSSDGRRSTCWEGNYCSITS